MVAVRWLIRLVVVVAAFFVGSFLMFLFLGYAVFGFFESGNPAANPDRPTTQDWFNVLTTLAGLVVAGFVWLKTKRLTQRSSENAPPGL